jgi:predicted lipid-binding transport protein (Tim44 family)
VATPPQDGDLDDEDVEADGRRAPVKPSFVDRLRSGVQPNGGTDPAGAPRSTKRAIERLDDRERLLSFAAAGLAVVAGVLIYVVETEQKFHPAKGELSAQTTLIIGLVTGAALLAGTLIGRRAPVGFVALFTFLAFGTQYFAGIPFLVLAVWLLYRSYKFQKEAAATRKAMLAENPSSSPSRARGSTARTASTKSAPKTSAKKGPAAPEANKRYTPKRPPPPAPKPSRRDRKAAQATD